MIANGCLWPLTVDNIDPFTSTARRLAVARDLA